MTRAALASLSTGLRCLLCVALFAPGAAFAEDPEAVYRRFHAAVIAGDLDGMRPYMRAARRAEMDATPAKDRAAIAQFLVALTPADITVTKTTLSADGQRAQLEAHGIGKALIGEGTDPMTGVITLVVEDGTWKIDTSNWKSEERKQQ